MRGLRMMRRAVLLAAALCACAYGAGQTVQQVLVPREVYVGDTAVLTYTFSSGADFFALADSGRVSGDTLVLDHSRPPFGSQPDACTVQGAVLHRSGQTYSLVVTFVPWRVGRVDFAPFNLYDLCRSPDASATALYQIDIAPVTVASLAEKLGETALRPPAPPVLLPGTRYVVWAIAIALILLVAGLAVLLAKLHVVRELYYSLCDAAGLLRNAQGARRKLRRLGAARRTDAEFAAEWQAIVRGYLEYRFRTPFAAVTTGRIAAVIREVTGGMMGDAQEDALLAMVALFTRTDYILFARGSIESRLPPAEEHQAAFAEGERAQLVARTLAAIDGLESGAAEEAER